MSSSSNTTANQPSPAFFRLGALAAAAAVLGILLAQVVFVPSEPEPGVAGLIALYADSVFQAQSLTILLQVMAMFVALLVLAVKVFPRSPGATILAVAFLFFWQVLELYPRAVDYFAFARSYADAYLAGGSNAASVEAEFQRFFEWAAAIRSMRLIVWSAGLTFLGVAVIRTGGIGRWIGVLLLLNGIRVAAIFILSMAGAAIPFGLWLFVLVNASLFGLLAYSLWTAPRVG